MKSDIAGDNGRFVSIRNISPELLEKFKQVGESSDLPTLNYGVSLSLIYHELSKATSEWQTITITFEGVTGQMDIRCDDSNQNIEDPLYNRMSINFDPPSCKMPDDDVGDTGYHWRGKKKGKARKHWQK